jgi:hypothetical protein
MEILKKKFVRLKHTDIQLAKDRQASELELQKIREAHDFKVEELRRKNANALEAYRRTAPTDEQRNLDSYLAKWKKVPANKDKDETEGYSQFWMDRRGGSGAGDKPYITGQNQLLQSYLEELKTLELQPETNPEKIRVRAAIKKAQRDLEAAVGRGIPVNANTGDVDSNNPLLK